jgi:hypothetical protein
VPFVDRAIQSCQSSIDFLQGEEHLHGIKQQLLSTKPDVEKVNNLVGFLDDIDFRRKRDWRAVFPQIVEIVEKIRGENNV